MKKSAHSLNKGRKLAFGMLSVWSLLLGINAFQKAPSHHQKEAMSLLTANSPIDNWYSLNNTIGNPQGEATIYLANVDFNNNDGSSSYPFDPIIISRSLTVIGDQDGEPALLNKGGFIINGPSSGPALKCEFVNINFDGEIDGSNIAADYWQGDNYRRRARSAFQINGNVELTIKNCSVRNYMNSSGGGILADYSTSDNRLANLRMTLLNSQFDDNHAYYQGGAISLSGYNKNISFSADDCTFQNNTASIGRYINSVGEFMFSNGGGGISGTQITATLKNCQIKNNLANRLYYELDKRDSDGSEGGGIGLFQSDLQMLGCLVIGNAASLGGGLALRVSNARIDGCVFRDNVASTPVPSYVQKLVEVDGELVWEISDELIEGMRNNQGIGGAIYTNLFSGHTVKIINTSIYNNRAQNAYGGLSMYYSELSDPLYYGWISLIFCTYLNNTTDYTYDFVGANPAHRWFYYPGDLWSIPNLTIFGSMVSDPYFETVYPRSQEPEAQNEYNCFTTQNGLSSKNFFSVPVTLEHLVIHDLPNAQYIIPNAQVRQINDQRFLYALGDFRIGDNFCSTTVNLDTMGGHSEILELEYNYAADFNLPTPTRNNHEFRGWFTIDNKEFINEETSLPCLGADLEALFLYAHWDFVFPVWGTVLILIGLFLILGISLLVLVLQRRKKVMATNNNNTDLIIQINEERLQKIVQEYNITTREQEVMRLLAEGKSQSAIAETLFIGTETVKTHIKNIYEKIGVSSKYELIAKLKN